MSEGKPEHFHAYWIDDDYGMQRVCAIARLWRRAELTNGQLSECNGYSDVDDRTRIGLHWPGIVITDEPSPGLVSKGE